MPKSTFINWSQIHQNSFWIISWWIPHRVPILSCICSRRRLLRVPWTARRSNQEINPEYSLEGLMLKLQYFGHLMWRAGSLEKTLMLGKIEGRRRRGWQKMRWFEGITDSMDMNMSKLQEIVENRGAWRAAVPGVTKNWTQLSDWTELIQESIKTFSYWINGYLF